MLKALTLHQPWASAIAWGLKSIETRSWPTNYRGPLAIHAGMTSAPFPLDGSAQLLAKAGPQLPRGAIVAVAALADVCPVEAVDLRAFETDEVAWGDFTAGRFAWMLTDVIRLPNPINVKGSRQLWTASGILAKAINDQIEETR